MSKVQMGSSIDAFLKEEGIFEETQVQAINIRRLPAKYGYPPDLTEDATQLVLRQAELSTEKSG